jgi:hypothetical protein
LAESALRMHRTVETRASLPIRREPDSIAIGVTPLPSLTLEARQSAPQSPGGWGKSGRYAALLRPRCRYTVATLTLSISAISATVC